MEMKWLGDAITLPYRSQAIDAEFKDKDDFTDNDTVNEYHSAYNIDEETGEVLEPEPVLDDFPEPNEQYDI